MTVIAVNPLPNRGVVVVAVAFLALAPVAAVASNGTVILLAMTLLGLSRTSLTEAVGLARRHPLIAGGLALLVVWSFVSLLWTPEVDAERRAGRTVLIAFGGWLSVALIHSLDQRSRHLLRGLIGVSGLALAALLGVELATGGALGGFVRTGQFIGPASGIGPAARGTAVLTALAWPAAYAISVHTGKAGLAALFVAACAALALLLGMNASFVALLFGLIALVVSWRARRIGTACIVAGFALFFALAPPLADTAIDGQSYTMSDALPNSWRHRLVIWEHASQLIGERPVRGHGFDAAREISRQAEAIPMLIDGRLTNVSPLPLHPHSAAFQIWLELGAIGVGTVLLMLSGMFRLLTAAGSTSSMAMPVATFSSTMTIFLLSFGVWQNWWLATAYLAAGAVVVVRSSG